MRTARGGQPKGCWSSTSTCSARGTARRSSAARSRSPRHGAAGSERRRGHPRRRRRLLGHVHVPRAAAAGRVPLPVRTLGRAELDRDRAAVPARALRAHTAAGVRQGAEAGRARHRRRLHADGDVHRGRIARVPVSRRRTSARSHPSDGPVRRARPRKAAVRLRLGGQRSGRRMCGSRLPGRRNAVVQRGTRRGDGRLGRRGRARRVGGVGGAPAGGAAARLGLDRRARLELPHAQPRGSSCPPLGDGGAARSGRRGAVRTARTSRWAGSSLRGKAGAGATIASRWPARSPGPERASAPLPSTRSPRY